MNRWGGLAFSEIVARVHVRLQVCKYLSVSRPQVKVVNPLFAAFQKVWLTAENACVDLSNRSDTSRRSNVSLVDWTRRTCFKSRKAAWWVVTVTFWRVVKQQSQMWFSTPVPREAFQLSEKTGCWLPTAAYLIQVCPPLVHAPVFRPLFWHDEDLGRGRKPREHRDQELLLAHPRDL